MGLAALLTGMVVLCSFSPARPNVVLPLGRGETFRLTEMDSGTRLVYGGSYWQRLLAKNFGSKIPKWVPGERAQVYPAHFTNGIGMIFRRQMEGHPLVDTDRVWNTSGQLYLVGEGGREQAAITHEVCFDTEKNVVVAEELWWEVPASKEKMLRLWIYETNSESQKVSMKEFWVPNPGW